MRFWFEKLSRLLGVSKRGRAMPLKPVHAMPRPVATKPPAPKTRFDLVAVDIDGTLLCSERTLTPHVIEAVRAAADQGVHIVLSSARPPLNAQHVLQQLGLDTHMICFNGTLICRGSDLKIIQHWSIDSALALEAAHLVRQIYPKAQIRADVIDKWYTDRFQSKNAQGQPARNRPAMVDRLEHILVEPVTRLTFLGHSRAMREARKALAEHFGGLLKFEATDDRIIQLSNPKADKGVALERVCAMYGVERSRVMAIGDAPNDLPMLEWAGCAVAVANSYAEVLTAADIEVASNNRHGVAEAIRKYVLSKGPTPRKKNAGRPDTRHAA